MIKRLITGLVLTALFLPVLYLGQGYYLGLIAALSFFIIYELLMMYRLRLFSIQAFASFGMALPLFFLYFTQQATLHHPLMLAFILFIILACLLELKSKTLLFYKTQVIFRVLFLIGFLLPFLGFIRLENNGLLLSLLYFCIIWTTDSGAYFVGQLLGKTPLTSISPKKTWEGTIGGIFIALVTGFLFYPFLSFSVPFLFFLILLTAIFSQLSDLHASLTKRFFNVKDSSQLLPGHGGFYDRCDSYLFTAPLFYFYIIYL